MEPFLFRVRLLYDRLGVGNTSFVCTNVRNLASLYLKHSFKSVSCRAAPHGQPSPGSSTNKNSLTKASDYFVENS